MTVADRVRLRREELGLSQEALAHKMGLKSRSSITRIEKSGDDISLKDVERLSEALNCSPLYLMDWINDINNSTNKDNTEEAAEQPLTDKEKHFIETYAKLSADQQKLVDNLMSSWLSTQESGSDSQD